MYYRMYAAWSFSLSLSLFLSERNWKQQHVCSATNRGQFKIAITYHTCCLSLKKKKTYTTCKLLHKRKAQSLRKMQ